MQFVERNLLCMKQATFCIQSNAVQFVFEQLCCVIRAVARTVSWGQEQGQGLHRTALLHQTQPLGLMAAAQTA